MALTSSQMTTRRCYDCAMAADIPGNDDKGVNLPKELRSLPDGARIPVRYFEALLPFDVWDEFLYSDDPQTLGRLKELLSKTTQTGGGR